MSIKTKTIVFGLVSGALAAIVAALAYPHAVWASVAMVASVVIAAAFISWLLGLAEGLVALMIVASLIDRYTFPFGPVNIRPEQIAALLALAALGWLRFRDGRWATLLPNRTEVLLLGWFAVGLLSSVLVAPERARSVKVLGLLVVSSLAFFLPRRLLGDGAETLDRVVRWLLVAFALAAGFATLMYLTHAFGPTIAMSANPAGGHLNAYGTLWEPNVLGSVCGSGALAWAFLGARHFKRHWIGTTICLAGCVVSYARGAWLAVIIVLTITIATALRRRIDMRGLWIAEASTLVVIAAMIVAEHIGTYTVGPRGLAGVLGAVGNGSDLIGRLRQFPDVFHDLKRNPLIGLGIDSYGEMHKVDSVPQQLGNLELSVLNDTGVIGLVLFAGVIVLIAAAAWKYRSDDLVLGLSAMLLVMGLANQATETLELMITWLMVGLLLTALQQASARIGRDTGS